MSRFGDWAHLTGESEEHASERAALRRRDREYWLADELERRMDEEHDEDQGDDMVVADFGGGDGTYVGNAGDDDDDA